VVTDYTGINEMIEHGMGNLQAGICAGIESRNSYGYGGRRIFNNIAAITETRKVTLKEIDRACRLILEAKYKLGLFTRSL
jgi:beta-glucosidase